MGKVKIGALAATCVIPFALSGCSTGAELKAPTLEASPAVVDIAIVTTLKEIRVSDEQLCPVNEHGALLLFSGSATGPADGSYLEVNGTKIEVGDVFETGQQSDIEGGSECGGEHYDKASHVLVEKITKTS